MGKIVRTVYSAVRLDCGHIIPSALRPHGTEAHCPVCADNEKRVTAARMEMLQEVRKRLRGAITTANGMRVFDISIDKLIAELEATR